MHIPEAQVGAEPFAHVLENRDQYLGPDPAIGINLTGCESGRST
jgi:hypothetical protein